MKYDFKDLYEGPRFQNRARKRKIKLIITGIAAIIGIVLIISVINIFSGGSEEANVAPEDPNTTEQAKDNTLEEPVDDAEAEDTNKSIDTNESIEEDNISEKVSPNKKETSNHLSEKTTTNTTKTEASEGKVVRTTEENWEPVGTEQEGEHVTDFTKGSNDWEEMTQAIGSATGLSNDNMIVWWMGNGGASDKATSTVSTKDKGTYYRVQLEWVNGSGWKPLKVEEVKGNDSQPVKTESATSSNTETTNNR